MALSTWWLHRCIVSPVTYPVPSCEVSNMPSPWLALLGWPLRNRMLCRLSPLPLICMLGNMHVACSWEVEHEYDWECLPLDLISSASAICGYHCPKCVIVTQLIIHPKSQSYSCFVIRSLTQTKINNSFIGPVSVSGSADISSNLGIFWL